MEKLRANCITELNQAAIWPQFSNDDRRFERAIPILRMPLCPLALCHGLRGVG
jgi:hypothetical protein